MSSTRESKGLPTVVCPQCGAKLQTEPVIGQAGRIQARCNHGVRLKAAEPVWESDAPAAKSSAVSEEAGPAPASKKKGE